MSADLLRSKEPKDPHHRQADLRRRQVHPGEIHWGADSQLRRPSMTSCATRPQYVAAFGGDVHNYQRYLLRFRKKSTLRHTSETKQAFINPLHYIFSRTHISKCTHHSNAQAKHKHPLSQTHQPLPKTLLYPLRALSHNSHTFTPHYSHPVKPVIILISPFHLPLVPTHVITITQHLTFLIPPNHTIALNLLIPSLSSHHLLLSPLSITPPLPHAHIFAPLTPSLPLRHFFHHSYLMRLHARAIVVPLRCRLPPASRLHRPVVRSRSFSRSPWPVDIYLVQEIDGALCSARRALVAIARVICSRVVFVTCGSRVMRRFEVRSASRASMSPRSQRSCARIRSGPSARRVLAPRRVPWRSGDCVMLALAVLALDARIRNSLAAKPNRS